MAFKFADRAEAGRQLAPAVAALNLDQPLIYALPRGGVPVAVEVARALKAPLDLMLVRKLGAPGNPELALGAIVEGTSQPVVINESIQRSTNADDAYLRRVIAEQTAELERRRGLYLGGRARLDPTGRTVVVVDDGLATGATMKAALIGLRRNGAAWIVVALPVAPKSSLDEVSEHADEVICLHPVNGFRGVGGYYRDFHQLSDAETVAILNTLQRALTDPGNPPQTGQTWQAGHQDGQPDGHRTPGASQGVPGQMGTDAGHSARIDTDTSEIDILRAAAEPLPAINHADFARAFDRFGSKRVVLLGEATHGTSEFYRARATITRRLIEEHGFSIVAIEADWPDAAAVDRFIRHSHLVAMNPPPFARFPTWMWRNIEFDVFTRFLQQHNRSRRTDDRVSFFGLDLYNMNASIAAVLAYLDRVDEAAADVARARYACLQPWSRNPAAYGRAALGQGYAICEKPVTQILVDLLKKQLDYVKHDGERFFDAAQNARLVATAERYYRAMYYASHKSWNLRDRHMFLTLEQILDHAGPDSKAVVWAHNSHIGDARYSDMGRIRGEVTLGQLCREAYRDDAALIGFGTGSGTVAAASEWDAPMEIKSIRPPRPGSTEAQCRALDLERFIWDFRKDQSADFRRLMAHPRPARNIGVIYRPQTEADSHMITAALSDQFDAYVWFDQTNAVAPLVTLTNTDEDETYPFGL